MPKNEFAQTNLHMRRAFSYRPCDNFKPEGTCLTGQTDQCKKSQTYLKLGESHSLRNN